MSRIQEVVDLPAEEDEARSKTDLIQVDEDDEFVKGDIVLDKIEQPHGWITAGSVRFQNVVLKYREDLPPALRNLSFRIAGGRKVGIVGRSGCGKSTCLSALFRMVRFFFLLFTLHCSYIVTFRADGSRKRSYLYRWSQHMQYAAFSVTKRNDYYPARSLDAGIISTR